MKKFFTILPIFNVIIAFFYMILWNNMDSFENDAGFLITLFVMIILIYGGIAVIGIIAGIIEKTVTAKTLVIKIIVNFIFSFVLIYIVLFYGMRNYGLYDAFKQSLLLTLENILGYGITLMVKYKNNR